MQPLRAGYTVNPGTKPQDRHRFPYSRFGWLVFYICFAQWSAVIILCFAQLGHIVTAYYSPVLTILKTITPATTLAAPTLQAGMIWLATCMMFYGTFFATICSFWPHSTRKKRRR